jgi:hypothetical protein
MAKTTVVIKKIKKMLDEKSTPTTPFVNISIHPKPRKLATKIRRKANHARNRMARAAINQEYRGESGSKKAGEYHMKLAALSQGMLMA